MGWKASATGGYKDVDTGGIKWKDLERLLRMDEESNRPNRMGAFGGWQYDPKTRTQKWVTTDPGAAAAQKRMSGRMAGEGFESYKPPSSTSAIRDAVLQSRMDRMGVSAPPPVDSSLPGNPNLPPPQPPPVAPPVGTLPPPPPQGREPDPNQPQPPTDQYPIKGYPPSQLYRDKTGRY
jgi:hypothetical protein